MKRGTRLFADNVAAHFASPCSFHTLMATEVTKTQIDRLGERLKKGKINEADLRLLDQYRRSFSHASEVVVRTIHEKLALEPTERLAKSTPSIIEKLRRESIRLTQMQDIAGCRLIVSDSPLQETVVQSLVGIFDRTTLVDRRKIPSHGYRAVHVIVRSFDNMVEIQVRTRLQHLWAELSEKMSDMWDPAIKYGGGRNAIKNLLTAFSSSIASIELVETGLSSLRMQMAFLGSRLGEETQQRIIDFEQELPRRKQEVVEQIRLARAVTETFGTKK